MNALVHHAAVEVRIGNVGLAPKLDALAAALDAVKAAHRDTMPTACWRAIGEAQDALARATMTAGGSDAPAAIDASRNLPL